MNALEAMPDGGDLVISCSHANDTWRVAVSDSGPGIPQEIRDKIFNLYFTTKENGSGMGLAMAYRFVQLLNGRLSITSEPGDRTTFLFELPEALFEPWTPTSALSQGHRA
jgi:signal transduction histidine kinase